MLSLSHLSSDQQYGIRRALADNGSLPTTLRVCLEALFGPNIFSQDPDELLDPLLMWRIVYDELEIEIPEENENRINALSMALTTDAFYYDAETFAAICNAFYSGDLPDNTGMLFEDITLPEMLWAIFEMDLNRESEPEIAQGVLNVMIEVLTDHVEEPEAALAETDVFAGATSTEVGLPEDVTLGAKSFIEDIKEDLLMQLESTGLPWRDYEYLKGKLEQ